MVSRGASQMFPFEWCVASVGLEFLDEVVRGAEARPRGDFFYAELAFQQKPLRLRDTMSEDGFAERLAESGGTDLV